ncbi:Uncharacterised protein [Vibrio cholerae]|nr:Uncharacterised protein [Vibrio cholerae]
MQLDRVKTCHQFLVDVVHHYFVEVAVFATCQRATRIERDGAVARYATGFRR